MLSLVALRRLFEKLGTPTAGQKLIEDARRNAPVRKVQSNSNNVITKYFSRKMGRHIASESRTVEHRAVVMYEHDPKILEYFAQPTRLDVKWQGPNDQRPSRFAHTPDFLLITEEGFVIEEWREEARLLKQCAQSPDRIVKDASGWRNLAVEEHLGKLGISYRLRSANEHPQIYIQNLDFLHDYLDSEWPPVGEKALAAIQSQFQDQAGLPLLHLLDRGRSTEPGKIGGGGYSADDVYKAIADGLLCVDLKGELLSDTNRVIVYRDKPALELGQSLGETEGFEVKPVERRDVSIDPGCQVDYDGVTYTLVRVGAKTATLQNKDSSFDEEILVLIDKHQRGLLTIHPKEKETQPTLPVLDQLPPKRVEEILSRMKLLDMAEADPASVSVSIRTIQRYRKMVRNAGEHVVDQRVALASRIAERGNRDRRISDRLLELITQVARDHYNTATNKKKTVAYRYFQQACEAESLIPCSMNSFNRELEIQKSVKARMGKRMSYQEEAIVWYLKSSESIHGVRPFQYVHIDHTQLDLQLVSSESRKVLGKPWLTLAVDAESREVVGFYLTFEAPSYRSCMMVIRDIVKRHGRMPEMLILDNGKEFHSKALTNLCELYRCSLRYRVSGKPRYGSVMERMFGTTNTQFIHQLEGNTQLMKYARSVTKAVLPENFAVWTLAQLHGGLDYYFSKLYGMNEHPAHGEAPTVHFRRRMEETGERQHRLVRFDSIFLIETCPPPSDRPTRQVDGKRGVKIRHIWFWNDLFVKAELRNKHIEVRVDPWDPGTVFALAMGKWVACRSTHQATLSKLTETERRYLFEEIAKRLGGRIGTLTPHRLAEWLHVLEPKNFDPDLAERQNQGKALYEAMGMTQAASGGPVPKSEVPVAVVEPLKTRKATSRAKTERREKPKVRRAVSPIEVESDDYSLF